MGRVEEFKTWLESIEPDIVAVQEILAERLSDNPSTLTGQLTKIEAWHGRVTSMSAWSNSYLSQAESEELMSRDEGWTDLDRKADMKWKTAPERRMSEILEGLSEGIKSRLILGMALLKSQAGERSSGRSFS